MRLMCGCIDWFWVASDQRGAAGQQDCTKIHNADQLAAPLDLHNRYVMHIEADLQQLEEDCSRLKISRVTPSSKILPIPSPYLRPLPDHAPSEEP
jgi:hypothetical protein